MEKFHPARPRTCCHARAYRHACARPARACPPQAVSLDDNVHDVCACARLKYNISMLLVGAASGSDTGVSTVLLTLQLGSGQWPGIP